MQVIFAILMVILGHPAEAYQNGTAPFCIMDDDGNTECYYYSMSSCEQAVKYRHGSFCVAR